MDKEMDQEVTESVVGLCGDRFDDLVENVKLYQSVIHVLHYAKDIADNDKGDIEAQNCVKVLESLKVNTSDLIGEALE